MPLDLILEEGRREETPRRYRHEAEPSALTLIYLYFATMVSEDGKNLTENPHPLRYWFTDRQMSHAAKFTLQWHHHDMAGVLLAHPNTRKRARTLYGCWVDRYHRQISPSPKREDSPSLIAEIFNIAVSTTEGPLMKSLRTSVHFRDYWSNMRARCMQSHCGRSGIIWSRCFRSTRTNPDRCEILRYETIQPGTQIMTSAQMYYLPHAAAIIPQ